MTRDEAILLYRQGEEATVAVLLALAAEIEELKASRLAGHKNAAKKPAPHHPDVDPVTPSGMIAPYEKASSHRKRRHRPGRKNGHSGVRRRKPERIDQIKEHKLDCCPNCHTSFPGQEPCEIRSRYTEEIPQVQAVVTEHRIYRYDCKTCDQIVEAPLNQCSNKLLHHSQLLFTMNNLLKVSATGFLVAGCLMGKGSPLPMPLINNGKRK